MSDRFWHRRYHADALLGFISLTLEERGAYQTILDLIYDRRGPIPDNERLLAGYMGCSVRKWRALRDDLIAKGKLSINSAGLITNSRAEKEIENDAKTSRKHAENGLKGARTLHEKSEKPSEINEGDPAGLEPGHGQLKLELERKKKEEEKPRPLSTTASGIAAVMKAGGMANMPSDTGLLREWIALGANLDRDIIPVVERIAGRVKSGDGRPPFKFRLFDPEIREKLASDAEAVANLQRKTARIAADIARQEADDAAAAAEERRWKTGTSG